jgi:LPXTG-motif cell wall-anchored protein
VSGNLGAADAFDGEDGSVIVRWAVSLPDTGMNVQPWMIGAGIATVAAGALFASGVLRTRRQGRHSA